MVKFVDVDPTKEQQANPIKNWTNSEYVTYTDLNNNFNHLHANLGHGHGPIITANDISSNAGIRPEQTTFGTNLNHALVAVGSWAKNPDAGAFLPINTSGTLALTITPSSNGVTITGAAEAGGLSDGGTNIYTVFTRSLSKVSATRSICMDDSSSIILSSPLTVNVACHPVDGIAYIPGFIVPEGISVEVYNNKVQ